MQKPPKEALIIAIWSRRSVIAVRVRVTGLSPTAYLPCHPKQCHNRGRICQRNWITISCLHDDLCSPTFVNLDHLLCADMQYCERNEPCQNGAECVNDGSGGYVCVCEDNFAGTNCDVAKQRESAADFSHHCQNGGTCIYGNQIVGCEE